MGACVVDRVELSVHIEDCDCRPALHTYRLSDWNIVCRLLLEQQQLLLLIAEHAVQCTTEHQVGLRSPTITTAQITATQPRRCKMCNNSHAVIATAPKIPSQRVARALSILPLWAQRGPLGVTVLARHLGDHKSTAT